MTSHKKLLSHLVDFLITSSESINHQSRVQAEAFKEKFHSRISNPDVNVSACNFLNQRKAAIRTISLCCKLPSPLCVVFALMLIIQISNIILDSFKKKQHKLHPACMNNFSIYLFLDLQHSLAYEQRYMFDICTCTSGKFKEF